MGKGLRESAFATYDIIFFMICTLRNWILLLLLIGASTALAIYLINISWIAAIIFYAGILFYAIKTTDHQA
jgi:hypothetical protein